MAPLVFRLRALACLQVIFASAKSFTQVVSPLSGYNLSWSIDAAGKTITVKMQAMTAGWIGFGVTEAGGMNGADILVGWVNSDGVANISDTWAFGLAKPVVDTCQSWQLVASQSSESCSNGNCITTIVATRALVTGDSQDRDLVDDGLPNQIIVAYGSTDTFLYHGPSNRVTTSVNFFRAETDPLQSLRSDINVYTFEHQAGNYTIPPKETTYKTFCVDVSGWNLSHIVGFEAIIDPPASLPFVHHFVYQTWDTPDCKGFLYKSAIWLWGPGIPGMALPSQAGFRLGNNSDIKGLQLEIHYHNAASVAGTVDNSGVRSFVTQKLRQYDAGILQVGDPSVAQRDKVLPTGNSKATYSCLSEYSRTVASNNKLTAFGRNLHMHSNGVKMVSQQYSAEGSLRRSSQIEYYNWHYQGLPRTEMTTWDILPGDQFRVDCYYDTGMSSVAFGLGSNQEMCIDFIYYFPYTPSTMPSNLCMIPFFGQAIPITVPSGADATNVSLFLNRNFGTSPATCPVIPRASNTMNASTTSIPKLAMSIMMMLWLTFF